MRRVDADDWWMHEGPLALVFTGLPTGTLVLPVRLPTSPSNQSILDHHLADRSRWHKVDLVRHRDPHATGGWRYEAHLLALINPYVAPATKARRAGIVIATADRRAGIDVNVSNITVVSHDDGRDLRITRIDRHARDARREGKAQRRQRQLDRSRRAANPDQYELSPPQAKRARRRALAGLPPKQTIPRGARRSVGARPQQAYRDDRLSTRYLQTRAAINAASNSETRARRDHARRIAHEVVGDHGFQLIVEDCDLRAWARRWGKAVAAFSPGLLLSALEREAFAVASLVGGSGGVSRASTRTTVLSQHCLCGQRVEKTLRERVHDCRSCGLRGDRDVVSAALAAFVVLADRTEPASASVDYAASRATLEHADTFQVIGRQDALSESTSHSSRDGSIVAEMGRTPDNVVVARRTVGTAARPTPDEPGLQTTPERSRMRTNMPSSGSPPLPDTS
jgi:hypothetical protein